MFTEVGCYQEEQPCQESTAHQCMSIVKDNYAIKLARVPNVKSINGKLSASVG